MVSLNNEQVKLLANFSSDVAKAVLLTGGSRPFLSKELTLNVWILTFINFSLALIFLFFAVRILKGAKND